ncbi:MAG: 2Fe-2S iron-sulfur cluster binding domain-containing protein [Cellvibrionaceae bacterium]
MVSVYFQESNAKALKVECDSSQTLLEGLLAAGVGIPNSCRAGLCQACLCQGQNQPFEINPEAQDGLSDLQRRNHLLLACQATPVEGLSISLPTHDGDWLCELHDKRWLSSTVVELTFRAEGEWRAGQHLLVWMSDDQVRPYSASNPCNHDRLIRFVVERHEQGIVSRWCHDQLSVGDKVRLSRPQGEFYLPPDLGGDLVLFAEGSGIGPASGIIQSALAVEPSAVCDLFFVHSAHSAAESAKLPQGIAEKFDGFAGVRIHAHDEGPQKGINTYSRVKDMLERHSPSLRGKSVFIVGSEAFVTEMSRACFFSGAARNDIFTEIFVSQVPG